MIIFRMFGAKGNLGLKGHLKSTDEHYLLRNPYVCFLIESAVVIFLSQSAALVVVG
jgi:hypothetical protein